MFYVAVTSLSNEKRKSWFSILVELHALATVMTLQVSTVAVYFKFLNITKNGNILLIGEKRSSQPASKEARGNHPE